MHEVYARMVGQQQPTFKSRAHFLSIAARAMRQILIDYARKRKAEGQMKVRDRISNRFNSSLL